MVKGARTLLCAGELSGEDVRSVVPVGVRGCFSGADMLI